MGTIPSYPGPARPLDGNELVAAWQDGRQIALPAAALGQLGGTARSGAYRYGGFAVDAIQPGEILMDHEVVAPHTLAPDLGGCAAGAGTPPATPWTLTLELNGAALGSITIDPTGAASFATIGGLAHNVLRGDVVTVSAPLLPDPQIRRVRFTLAGEAN